MFRALRLAWVLLLTLAMPLQGMAALTMAACGPVHHSAHAVHKHEGLAQAAHEHDLSSHASPAYALEATADDAADDDAPANEPAHKCSVCASCCTASAGLPSHAGIAEPVALAGSFTALRSGGPPAFLTGGPERPPRSFPA
jgi:hypothetical protein